MHLYSNFPTHQGKFCLVVDIRLETSISVSLSQILQNEQLDEISSLSNEEVSAVSQAWFTTKEDKDSLTNKGKLAYVFL